MFLYFYEIDGQMGILVLEFYVVDIFEGNIREEIYMFVDIVVCCNLKVLVQVLEYRFFYELRVKELFVVFLLLGSKEEVVYVRKKEVV